jgi:phosphatidylglycerol---prolipoprotein diacylglyceryl transferase
MIINWADLNLDPVAVSFGPVTIYWYALAYLTGFLGGWAVAKWACRLDQNKFRPTETDIDDFMTWAILGILLGGRIGYVLFYNLPFYESDPLAALKIWQGGMAWHGGLIGVVTVIFAYTYFKKVELFRLADLFSFAAPIGFFFGRIANFVNGELYGRVTGGDFGVVFPRGGELPRYPSQLFQAVCEGLLLFIIMTVMMRNKNIRNRPGLISGVFLFCYGLFRFIIEFFREADAQIGYLALNLSLGQWLCVPMMLAGVGLFVVRLRRTAHHG